MKNTINLRTVFPSLAIVFCIIVSGANVSAQTLPSATELLTRASAKSHPRSVNEAPVTPNTLSGENLDPASGATRISAATSVNSHTVALRGSVNARSVSSTLIVSVNWGDGSVASIASVFPGRSRKSGKWSSSHIYASSGTYTVKASLMNASVVPSVVLATTTTSATINNPTPVLTSISPTNKVSGGTAFSLSLTGSNFTASSVVKWKGLNRTTHYISSTQLIADIPASDIMTAGTVTATPSFIGDWESGMVTGPGNHNWNYLEAVAPDRFTLLKDGGARQGAYYARVEVRPGDNPIATCCAGSGRAEVANMQDASGNKLFENLSSGAQQYMFSVKFDPTWKTTGTTYEKTKAVDIFLQLHGPNAINPAWSFNATDKIRFLMRTGDIVANTSVTERELLNGNLNKGKWIDFMFTVKYAKDNTGFINIQRRDEGETGFTEVLNIPNTPTLQYDPSVSGGAVGNHYMKYGLYSYEKIYTNVLYHDGFTRTAVSSDTTGTSSVAVFTPTPGGGTSASQTFTVTAPVVLPAPTATPASNPVPTLTSISPANKVSGGAAFSLSLTGSNFTASSVVKWKGLNKTTKYISGTQLTADILASDITTAGTSSVAIFTPTPGGGTSASQTFKVTAAPTPIPTTTTLTGNPSVFNGGATAGCTPHLSNDWIDTLDWSYRLLTPTDCAIVKITTPTFSWRQLSDRNLTIPWNFTLRNASNVVIFTAKSSSPRLLLDDYPLAPGTYSWQVNYTTNAGVVQTSVWRTFSIASDATTFKLPSGEAYAAMAMAKPSPRMLPTGATFASIVASANAGELKNPYAGFLWFATNRMLVLPIPSEPVAKTLVDFPSAYEYQKWVNSLNGISVQERSAIDYLAYAGKFTGDPKYDTAALARIMSLATWSPTGPTSEVGQDQANREVYLALAEGLDILGSQMTTAQRATVVAVIRDRVGQTINKLSRLDNQPYDSHLINNATYLVRALTLVVGTAGFPEAQEWLARSWETMITTAPVWGGADGSWGNSGGYAWFRLGSLVDTNANVRLATGVDLMKWPVFGKFGDTQIAQYAPIYAPVTALLRGSFGDSVEDVYFYRAYAFDQYRLFAKLTGKPSDEWYWRAGTASVPIGTAIPAINFMMLGLGLPPVTPAAPTNNSYAFEDSGIVALHTSTADPYRTSIFFRSSRLGSSNHSHADNNAFTFVSKGKEILISGGYYPYYNSPHHAMDGRATRYKNALTFDGGIGQAEPTSAPTAPGAPRFSADTRGQLINYFDNGIWATVTGDATLAYRGYNAASSTWKLTAWTPLLTEADRTVVFNRVEKVAIIYDYATSTTPRQWELNYHTMLNSPFIVSGGTIEIDNAPGKACIDHYGLPGSFTQTTAFDVAPEDSALPEQNHGRYTATTKSTVLTAVTVIREDCRTLPVDVTFSGSSASVSLNNSSPIIFDKKTVRVPAI